MKKDTIKTIRAMVLMFLGIFAICAILLDLTGVRVNGTQVYLHQIGDYESIVESSVPRVFTDTTEFDSVFTQELVEEHDFTLKEMLTHADIRLKVKYSYDEHEFLDAFEKYNKLAQPEEDAYIDVATETVVPEVYGTRVHTMEVYKALESGEFLTLSDYYIEPSVTAEYLENTSLKLLHAYRNWSVSYAGSDLVVSMPKDNVFIDESGVVYLGSFDFIDDFVDNELDSVYTTVGKDKDFVSHNGETVTVSGGTFGDVVDTEAEKECLKELCDGANSQTDRTPIYSHNDGALGNTYVEVSVDDQHVWFYQDGEIICESDCVTGCVAKRNDTPKGMWYVYDVATNRMLKPQGATTGSHVDRWMPFTPDGCGLHDASWRGVFGGEIYKSNGSHGCVNLPKKFAYEVYDSAYIGLPVIVY